MYETDVGIYLCSLCATCLQCLTLPSLHLVSVVFGTATPTSLYFFIVLLVPSAAFIHVQNDISKVAQWSFDNSHAELFCT